MVIIIYVICKFFVFSDDARGFISAPFGLLSESLSSSSSLLYQLIGKGTEDTSGGYYPSHPQAKELKSTRRMDVEGDETETGKIQGHNERAFGTKKRKRIFKYKKDINQDVKEENILYESKIFS